MTIDEAIAHAREVSSRKFDDRVHCIRCSEFHKQLAEWLEELKDHRERECNHINETLYDKGYSDGYNKAIEYFVMLFKSKTSMENSLVDEIAEQLKEGGENE